METMEQVLKRHEYRRKLYHIIKKISIHLPPEDIYTLVETHLDKYIEKEERDAGL